MSPSPTRMAYCVGGPLDGDALPMVRGAKVYDVWKAPLEGVQIFTYPQGVEPPPGCKLLGTYTEATGAANRGKLEWREAK